MDMVDERVRAVEKSVMRDFWVRAPLSAKVFLLATLCIVLYIFKSKLHDVQATRRERLCGFCLLPVLIVALILSSLQEPKTAGWYSRQRYPALQTCVSRCRSETEGQSSRTGSRPQETPGDGGQWTQHLAFFVIDATAFYTALFKSQITGLSTASISILIASNSIQCVTPASPTAELILMISFL